MGATREWGAQMCTNCSPRSSLEHIALIKFGESIFLIFHDQTLLEVALAQAQATSGSVVQLRLVQLRLVQLGLPEILAWASPGQARPA